MVKKLAGIGDNSAHVIPRDKLRKYIDRLECLIEDRKDTQTCITAVYREAKDDGFNVKVLRKIIKLREMNAMERAEQDALLEVYRRVFDL